MEKNKELRRRKLKPCPDDCPSHEEADRIQRYQLCGRGGAHSALGGGAMSAAGGLTPQPAPVTVSRTNLANLKGAPRHGWTRIRQVLVQKKGFPMLLEIKGLLESQEIF